MFFSFFLNIFINQIIVNENLFNTYIQWTVVCVPNNKREMKEEARTRPYISNSIYGPFFFLFTPESISMNISFVRSTMTTTWSDP